MKMKPNKNKIWAVTIALLLIGILILFQLSLYDSASVSEEELKIGIINFLTGPQAIIGEEANNVFLLANELENKKHKKQIKLFTEDSKDDPQTAITAYNKLKLENVGAMIATGDQVNYALSPLADVDKEILMMSIVGSDKIKGDYSFRMWGTTAEQCAKAIGDYATDELQIKKLALIHINNIYGESYKEAFQETVENKDGNLIASESYGIVDKDMSTQIMKVLKEQPEAIAVVGFGPAYPLVYKQLRELGWDGIILTDTAISVPYFFNAVGSENLNNAYYVSTLFDRDSPKNPEMQLFIEEYENKYNLTASWVGACVFDTYNILAETIRECEDTPEEIKECLENKKTIKGALGDMELMNHGLDVPILIKKVEGDEIKTVKRID